MVDGNKITLNSMEPGPPADVFIKNQTVFQMREEIQKSGAWLGDLNWALRYTESITEPFVTSEAPIVAEMALGVSAADALEHTGTLLYFPMCWQLCLFGSRQRFDLGTDKLGSHDMKVARKKYRSFAKDFLISPIKLYAITDYCET